MNEQQTFLFADLAGFTALTEAHGDERAADLVAEFCAQARRLLPGYQAEQVKTIGDALMIRAPAAASAVGLARQLAQEIGGQHGFPAVRVGVHSGSAIERDGDWYGATVNLASRVCGAAVAGEVLVTRDTRDAAAADLEDVQFRARGKRRFKNISDPIEVFAVEHQGVERRAQPVIDPVCRMAVDPGRPSEVRGYHGRSLVFCSSACAEAFDRSPERYVRRSSRSQLLVSDEARERGAAMLRRAYERGRLSLDELDERITYAYVARTRGDLTAVLRDLPAHRRWRRAAGFRAFWRSLPGIRWVRRLLRRRWRGS